MDEYLQKLDKGWDTPTQEERVSIEHKKSLGIIGEFFKEIEQSPIEILANPILLAKICIAISGKCNLSNDYIHGYITCYLTTKLEGK